MSCNICCDNYNKSTRSKVSCLYCNFDVCRTCCETYILSETIPKCMNTECAKEWSRKFLREIFTAAFLNSKYKEHLEDVLFDKEKALMPATQPLVEDLIRKKNISKEIKDLDNLINDLHRQRSILNNKLVYGLDNSATNEKSKFIRQCPANGCRGFLSTQWKCGICEQWSCPECHELKGSNRDCDHKCDQNSVETAKLLSKDSKPCPKCQSMIFKIEGCDHMWCTQCHTSFSWKTGALQSNTSNPHFFEWQRKNGGGNAPRNPGDIECGRELTHYTNDRIFVAARKHNDLNSVTIKEYTTFSGKPQKRSEYKYSSEIKNLCEIIRQIIHNNIIELPRFQTNYVTINQDLRIEYLQNKLSEKTFKIQIQRNDKRNKKNTEIAQVIQLANTAVTDIIYRIINDLDVATNGCHHLIELMSEFDEIINYCNDIFKDIAFTYTTTQYEFTSGFNFKIKEKVKKDTNTKMKDIKNDDSDEENNNNLNEAIKKLSDSANKL